MNPKNCTEVTDMYVYHKDAEAKNYAGVVRRYADGTWSSTPADGSTLNTATKAEAVLALALPSTAVVTWKNVEGRSLSYRASVINGASAATARHQSFV